MKFAKVTAAALMVSLASPLLAASEQSAGTLVSATSGTLIARDGKLLPARSGQILFVGDRVITRGSAKASVAMPGCNVSLSQASIMSVGSGCAAKSFAKQGDDSAAAGAEAGGSSTGYIIAGLAVAAVAGGVVAATSNTSTKSVSP